MLLLLGTVVTMAVAAVGYCDRGGCFCCCLLWSRLLLLLLATLIAMDVAVVG
jgi:hypothetical protein